MRDQSQLAGWTLSKGFFHWRFEMIAVHHQELIEVNVTQGGVIAIEAESMELGKKVSIYIQPENIEILVEVLLSAMKEAKDTQLLDE